MRNHRDYLGAGFEVWTSQRAWFWRLLHPDRDGGTIGVAGSEAEAIRDACTSIEEISARREAAAADGRVTMTKISAPMFDRRVSIPLASIHWSDSLTNLGRYLTRIRGASL
jgi:hypothetical protein